jgi:hypothetical protein
MVTVDGPLLALPVEWLPVQDRTLASCFKSISTVLSVSIASLAASCRPDQPAQKKLLCAVWEQHIRRRRNDALAAMRIGVTSESANDGWATTLICDDPLATPQCIEHVLQQSHHRIVVLGGHGLYDRAGLALASPRGKNKLWHGNGDFSQTELLFLCACAVGRMKESTAGDIRGMYTRFLVNGGTLFCGARWLIDSHYSVLFTLEVLKEVRKLEAGQEPFWIARAINRVRQRFLALHPQTHHAISAFGVFGVSPKN